MPRPTANRFFAHYTPATANGACTFPDSFGEQLPYAPVVARTLGDAPRAYHSLQAYLQITSPQNANAAAENL